MGINTLVDAWRQVQLGAPSFLPADGPVLDRWNDRTVNHQTFESYCEDPLFAQPDRRLHLGLLPMPYCGNLSTATIFLLLLNPGLHPADYYAEQHSVEYRTQAIANLHQTTNEGMFFLDPKWSWHPGVGYWLPRFSGLAHKLSDKTGSFRASLELLAKRVACLELIPYHSQDGADGRWSVDLESSRLMRGYVHGSLVPRAHKGEVLIVNTRRVADWGLEASRNIVVYPNRLARGGHISPGTPGGDAILGFLEENL